MEQDLGVSDTMILKINENKCVLRRSAILTLCFESGWLFFSSQSLPRGCLGVLRVCCGTPGPWEGLVPDGFFLVLFGTYLTLIRPAVSRSFGPANPAQESKQLSTNFSAASRC